MSTIVWGSRPASAGAPASSGRRRGSAPAPLLLASALALSACEHAPVKLAAMTPVELQTAPADRLCDAAAVYRGQGDARPVLAAEIARRGLDCSASFARFVSNCSALQIVGSETLPQGVVYTVRNSSPQMKRFRINNAHIASSQLRIAPGATARFPIAASSLEAGAARLANLRNPQPARLYECLPG